MTKQTSDEPNVDKLMVMLNDPISRGIIENVLIGDMSMNWNEGEPTFSLTEQGVKRVEEMIGVPND